MTLAFLLYSAALTVLAAGPHVIDAWYDPEEPGFVITFSAPVAPGGALPTSFFISGGIGYPLHVESREDVWPSDHLVLAVPVHAIHDGAYTIEITGLTGADGTPVFDTLLTVAVGARPPEASLPPGALVINEVFFDPPESEFEFVEVYNRSETALDLNGLTLRDASGRAGHVGEAAAIEPGGYVVLARDPAALTQAFPGISALGLSPWPALNNDGDDLVLSSGGVAVDSVAYRADWGEPDRSVERVDPYGPAGWASNWRASRDAHGATPGRVNSTYTRDTSPPVLQFAGQTALHEIEAWFNEPVDPLSVPPTSFSLDGISPVTVLSDGDRWRLTFAAPLPRRAGSLLAVWGVRDGAGNEQASSSVPVALFPEVGDLVLNEFLYEPLADPYDGRRDQPEYVEWFNRTGLTLSLNGTFLTGSPDEHGDADTLRLPDSYVLPPGGFAVAFAGSDASVSLEDAFPGTRSVDPARAVFIPIPASSLRLNNSGDRIALHRRDGMLLDEAAYDPRWHNPALAQTSGVALERISPDAPSSVNNWSSSTHPDGGTPGQPNGIVLPSSPEALAARAVAINPSPFSPDGDGYDDHALIAYSFGEAGGALRARIFDARGRIVRTLESIAMAAPTGSLIWDGRDDDGRDLRIGIYIVVLEATLPRSRKALLFREPVVLARPLD